MRKHRLGFAGNLLLTGLLVIQFALGGVFTVAVGIASPVNATVLTDEFPPHISILAPANASSFELSAAGAVAVAFSVQAPDNAVWRVTGVTFTVRDGRGNSLGTFVGANIAPGLYGYTWNANAVCSYQVDAVARYDDLRTVAAENVPVSQAARFIIHSPVTVNTPIANGIIVGQTKLFDDRSLAVMLQSLEASLANRSFVDQATLAGALGKFQGATQSTSALGISVSGLPVPGITTTTATGETTTTNQVVTQGVLLGATPPPQGTSTTTNVVTPNTTTSVVTQPAITPQPASLPSQTSAFQFQPPFGIAAQDLLAEQTSLTYQVLNLRLLLERSITDRVLYSSGEEGETVRERATVGFQVSIDSLKKYKDALAEVEITITSECPHDQPSSLVAMMPKDKTYNVATISKNARQFGFGAVAQVLSAGVSFGQTKEALYLIRDTDTVALERPSSGKSISFGWQFRPVLGRRTVEPGTRQVYAALALPVKVDTLYNAQVKVTTRWRRYDAKTGAVGDPIDGSVNEQILNNLLVNNSLGQPLQPRVDSVSWEEIGQGQVLVNATGQNFLPGTTLMVGGSILDNASNGLIVTDERNLRFVTTAARLAQTKDTLMFGRFGPPTEVRNSLASQTYLGTARNNPQWGIKVKNTPTIEAIDAQNSKVTLSLVSRNSSFPVFIDNQYNPPLVLVGSQVIGLVDAPITSKVIMSAGAAPTKQEMELSFVAQTQLLRDARKLIVKYPFWGEDFVAESPVSVESSFTANKITLLAADDSSAQLAISGNKFDQNHVQVVVGGVVIQQGNAAFDFMSDKLIRLNLLIGLKELKQISNVVVRQPDGAGNYVNVIIALPFVSVPSPKPKVNSQDTIAAGDSKTVKLQGANFASVKSVSFEGAELSFDLDEDGAVLKLAVPFSLTSLGGDKELVFTLKDGTSMKFTLHVDRK